MAFADHSIEPLPLESRLTMSSSSTDSPPNSSPELLQDETDTSSSSSDGEPYSPSQEAPRRWGDAHPLPRGLQELTAQGFADGQKTAYRPGALHMSGYSGYNNDRGDRPLSVEKDFVSHTPCAHPDRDDLRSGTTTRRQHHMGRRDQLCRNSGRPGHTGPSHIQRDQLADVKGDEAVGLFPTSILRATEALPHSAKHHLEVLPRASTSSGESTIGATAQGTKTPSQDGCNGNTTVDSVVEIKCAWVAEDQISCFALSQEGEQNKPTGKGVTAIDLEGESRAGSVNVTRADSLTRLAQSLRGVGTRFESDGKMTPNGSKSRLQAIHRSISPTTVDKVGHNLPTSSQCAVTTPAVHIEEWHADIDPDGILDVNQKYHSLKLDSDDEREDSEDHSSGASYLLSNSPLLGTSFEWAPICLPPIPRDGVRQHTPYRKEPCGGDINPPTGPQPYFTPSRYSGEVDTGNGGTDSGFGAPSNGAQNDLATSSPSPYDEGKPLLDCTLRKRFPGRNNCVGKKGFPSGAKLK
jgi:hypothetical protein